MSVWADMHRRSTGETVRKEDIPIQEEKNMWWSGWYDEVLEERKEERKKERLK